MWKDCTMIKKIKETDWWEVSYLIIYGIIFSKEFLQTTMFPIPWPLGLGYVFALLSGGYVIAKFLFHNTYTKKEMILAILVLIAFCVPALTTDYTFLFWTGCLIVGAKDVDFNKILKVYLVLSITFMVAAFAASQGGVIEDLVYTMDRGDAVYYRHSYGIVFPTDYAAHLFYLVIAILVLFEKQLTLLNKVWICTLVAFCVYFTSNARTTALCLMGIVSLSIIYKILGRYQYHLGKILQWIPTISAIGFIGLSYFYNPQNEMFLRLNNIFTERLQVSKEAFEMYDVKLFGQHIDEMGYGFFDGWRPFYFFLDDSYISILFKYGTVLFFVMLVGYVCVIARANMQKNSMMVIVLVAIAIHSIMEHHLLALAYNPMMLAAFSMYYTESKLIGGKICIEKTAEAG